MTRAVLPVAAAGRRAARLYGGAFWSMPVFRIRFSPKPYELARAHVGSLGSGSDSPPLDVDQHQKVVPRRS